MGHVVPLGKNLKEFLSPLGISEILRFSELLVYTEAVLVLLKIFPHHFEFASSANIEEVMKFYNLGDKTFETDFMKHAWSSACFLSYKLHLKHAFYQPHI